jgi:DNA-binding NarL/FixJ family response regulator
MTRVLIADDQDLVRAGLRMILDAADGLEVVGEAADGAAAVALAQECAPDVVLMDLRMPRCDGVQATRQLTAGATSALPKVLILTTFDTEDNVYEAMAAGASGFLLKTAPPARLIEAVHCVHAGEALLAPSITRRLIEEHLRRSRPDRSLQARLAVLTEREREVLTLIGRGRSNAEIARELVVAEATVKTHVNRVLGKLQLRDRVQAVVLAYESGLVAVGERPTGSD